MIRHTDVAPITQREYLEKRMHEEADAAVNASSIEATLIHVVLATAYALRFNGGSAATRQEAATWVDNHRIW